MRLRLFPFERMCGVVKPWLNPVVNDASIFARECVPRPHLLAHRSPCKLATNQTVLVFAEGQRKHLRRDVVGIVSIRFKIAKTIVYDSTSARF